MFMDEVIGMTNGYDCENRRKSITFWIKVARGRVLRLQGGFVDSPRRFFRATSF